MLLAFKSNKSESGMGKQKTRGFCLFVCLFACLLAFRARIFFPDPTHTPQTRPCAVTLSRIQLFETSQTITLEKAMAPHSSTLAWKIPRTEEPGRLQSMGSRRVGHNWATSLSLYTFVHWRRKWQPTPVFLPGEYQGRESLVGCRLWSRPESDTTEAT